MYQIPQETVTDIYNIVMNKQQYKPLSDIIDAPGLALLSQSDVPFSLFDCRSKLGEPGWGRSAFEAGHIDGAQFLDLDLDLADPPNEDGRHPLPTRERWLATVRSRGVGQTDQIVLYDDAGGAYAARAWWMFRWLGHDTVAVLDGGLAAWPHPLVTENHPAPQASNYQPDAPLTRMITTAELETLEGQHTLIDARTQTRFDGKEEPIDPIAGHIPGAVCYPFQANLSESGQFLGAGQLRDRFAGLEDDAICYCGSGVTACHNILAMHIAGLPEPRLYAPSWSGWITDGARPVDTA